MSELEKNARSLFDRFVEVQETFEDAKKKSSEESSKRVNYFRMQKDGTYVVRILPLAPVINAEGEFLPLERKGYEYPLRSLMLKIEDPSGKGDKGKPKITYVTVCNAKYALKNLESDLIDTFVDVACQKYADDEKLIKKLREGSFSGGLKWDSKRCIYIIDLENPSDGIQILQLSYSQYKDLEERKLNLWGKLNKNGRNVSCPISSIDAAYPVEIVRKSEKGKASYSFNIDSIAEKSALDEDTLQRLIDMPRLPQVIYRYTRYHLEATIQYLHQLEDKFDIQVMEDDAIRNCIEQIKLLLPADDNSHFKFGDKSDSKSSSGAITLDSLWERFDALDDAGLDDQSAEGQELRQDIYEFIDANDLNVKVSRRKTNNDLLDEIETAMHDGEFDSDESEEDSRKHSKPEPEEESEEPEESSGDNEEDDEPANEPAPRHHQRNDDTNEPAARESRRLGRPMRRR